ncbi:MAG: mechanosensitive ion channel family protein [Rhizobium sp.]|nr:mechanosensitive ion channel family protein [Rhizobium sp.]
MNGQTADFFVATRAAVVQAGQLAVQYSFSILGAIVLLILGWFISRMVHRWALAGMSKIRHFDITLAHFIANVVRYAIMVLVFVTVLGQFGVQTASIIAALGAAGLAIGLALQGTLQNIAAGIMLLILRPFRVGETIETKDVSGTIQEIGLFATELKTGDGLYQIAPNSLLWNTPVKNFSRFSTRRFDVAIILPLDSDLRKAETVLQSIASRDKRVKSKPAPTTSISEITNETVKLTLNVWLDTSDFGDASRDLSKAAKMSFDKVRVSTEQSEDKMAAMLPTTVPAG